MGLEKSATVTDDESVTVTDFVRDETKNQSMTQPTKEAKPTKHNLSQ